MAEDLFLYVQQSFDSIVWGKYLRWHFKVMIVGLVDRWDTKGLNAVES